MSAERKSVSVLARIGAIERELAAKLQSIADTEASIAQAYEDGQSPAAMVKQLSALRDEVAGAVSALRSLDRRHFEVASQEFQDGLQEVRKETERKFLGAVEAIEGALGSVDLGRFGLDAGALDPVKTDLRESLWTALQRQSVAAQQAVGKPPREPWPRDDLGRPVDPDDPSKQSAESRAAQYRISANEAEANRIRQASYAAPSALVEAVRASR